MGKRTAAQAGRFSREKGAEYERYICKRIIEILPGFEYKDCHRTPRSGGGFQKGDIVKCEALRQIFPFHIECKKQECWNMETLFSGKPSADVISWIHQSMGDCPVGEFPLLIFSKNFCNDYVIILPKSLEDDWTLEAKRNAAIVNGVKRCIIEDADYYGSILFDGIGRVLMTDLESMLMAVEQVRRQGKPIIK